MNNEKVVLLILLISFNLSVAIGQAPKSEVVNADMPPGAKQLTKEQLSTFVRNNYKKYSIPLGKENTYQLDGLVISFWDLSVNPEFKKSLEASQSEILGYLKWTDRNVINFSKIVTINNIRFLEYEYQTGDEVYLRFQSEFDKKNRNICGVIQCKEPDKDKAQKTMDDFLKTVHFKE